MLSNQYFTKTIKKTSSVFYSARFLESYQISSNQTFEHPHPFLDIPHKIKMEMQTSAKASASSALKLINNFKQYKPRFFNGSSQSIWHKVPVRRRSSVMVLLFEGDRGELRVILTKRSRQLKSFSGHVSFPGGKADSLEESEFDVARREMEEEIGLSRDNSILMDKFGCEIDEITTLPAYLARTFLTVAPCIGFIKWSNDSKKKIHQLNLNPGESSSIFSVPLIDFLKPVNSSTSSNLNECLKQSHIKTKWAGIPWNLRSFIFPVHNDNEIDWLQEIDDLSSPSENDDETHDDHEFDVRTRNCWGLTANILHDVAKIVYNGDSNILGEEDLINSLFKNGQIQTVNRTNFERRLINNIKGCSFGEVLSTDEFNSLKTLYTDTN